MQAVVLVPAFDRPEMVWCCLDHLAKCPEIGGVEVRVYIDQKPGRASLEDFGTVHAAHPRVTFRSSPRHTYRGNSYNTLLAFREAYNDGFDVCYLVEDDVMVSPEFFAWHQRVQEIGVAASVGVPDPGHGAYASLGVCLPRRTVADVLEHAGRPYFEDMRGYCRRAFPPSPFDYEQDGLIARVLAGRHVAWATPPVVSHVGWYGYHRKQGERPTGTLAERYRKVRDVMADPVQLAVASGGRGDVTIALATNHGTSTVSTVPGERR